VGLYMQNSAEFMFIWLGLAAIGAHPAMLNFHLTGEALAHGVRVSKARVLLVDEELRQRVEECVELKAIGIRVEVVSAELMQEVSAMDAEELPREMTEGIKGTDTLALRYTR
jgi:acyl-CoA synthetase (AMP-forming)/AMP-acid ligase II